MTGHAMTDRVRCQTCGGRGVIDLSRVPCPDCHASSNRVQNPPVCRHCGQPVQEASANSDTERWYHGDCYVEAHRLEPGPVALQSHDDLVQDGLERP